MTKKIIFSPESKLDLKNIKFYLNSFGNNYFKELKLKLKNSIDTLIEFPNIGKQFEEFRVIICGSYKIFYELTEDTIIIARIIDSKMDFN